MGNSEPDLGDIKSKHVRRLVVQLVLAFVLFPILIFASVLALPAAIGGLAVTLFNWRCPACSSYLGKRIYHRNCPSCGVSFWG